VRSLFGKWDRGKELHEYKNECMQINKYSREEGSPADVSFGQLILPLLASLSKIKNTAAQA